METVTINRWGNSKGIRIPNKILKIGCVTNV